MSASSFALAFLVGAAVLALWVTHRFPGRAPGSLLGVGAHVVLANVVASVAPAAAVWAMPSLGAVAALMLLALPPLVYFFLACAWLLMLLQRLVGSYR